MIELRDLIGVPYKVHGRDLSGLDCYGLVILVMERLGKKLPDVFYGEIDKNTSMKLNIIAKGLPLKCIEKPSEYCIITMNLDGFESHIAVYLGHGKIIHATKKHGVIISDIRLYKNKIVGMYELGV